MSEITTRCSWDNDQLHPLTCSLSLTDLDSEKSHGLSRRKVGVILAQKIGYLRSAQICVE